jgi:DNA-binding transcriptional LysR family regulator
MDLNDLRIFVVVAQHRSFTGAARQLGIGKSTASDRVRALEAQLGTRLLNRTTRTLSLTEAGDELLQRGLVITALAEEAQDALARSTRSAVGRLRVSVPLSFGLRFLTQVVADLMCEHPRLEIDYQLQDHDVDLVRERYDLALRIGKLADSSVVARRLGRSRRLTVAAPAYLQRCGRPAGPGDLEGHECLRYTHQRPPDRWSFSGPAGPQQVRISGRLESNNGDALAEAACHGLGIAWLPDFVVMDHVREGRLELLFEAQCQEFSPIQLIFPSRPYRTVKEELFARAVAARLEREG